MDAADNVYVFHTGTPSVFQFDADGNFLRSWGDEFAEGAHGFYLHKEGDSEFLYMTDISRGLMVKTTLSGEPVLTIETPNRPGIYDEDRRFLPTDVAVAPNGDIYIVDGYGQSWVHQYSASGQYIRSWGGLGDEAGMLNCPHGISVDLRKDEPEVYVADRGNHRIQVFSLDGEFKRMIEDDMDMPCSFYFSGSQMFFPDLNSRVTIFDCNDKFLMHLGEDQQAYKQTDWPNLPKSYYRENKFSSPHGVCVDSIGNVYVAEWTQCGRVTKLIPCYR